MAIYTIETTSDQELGLEEELKKINGHFKGQGLPEIDKQALVNILFIQKITPITQQVIQQGIAHILVYYMQADQATRDSFLNIAEIQAIPKKI